MRNAKNAFYFFHKARCFFQKRTVPFQSSHEGLNYAEMNLTDRRTPVAVSTLQPSQDTSYHLRQTSQIASTISVNSVV
jgi:hypothetical protein